jgi:hypothetical protein
MNSGLTAGQSYDISIASVADISQYGLTKKTLEGARSNPITLWAIDVPAKPTLSLSNTSRDSCSVVWTKVAPPTNSQITGYKLEIDDGLDRAFRVAYDGTSTPSKIEYTVQGLTQRTTYRLKVFAINKAGDGVKSDIITCFTATVPGQPGAPQLVSSSASTIKVKWAPAYDDGGSPIKEYQLYMD